MNRYFVPQVDYLQYSWHKVEYTPPLGGLKISGSPSFIIYFHVRSYTQKILLYFELIYIILKWSTVLHPFSMRLLLSTSFRLLYVEKIYYTRGGELFTNQLRE